MCSNYGLTEDFMLIEITLGILKRKAVQFFCSWRKLNYGRRRMLDCIAWAPYTQEIHSYFASNGKFVTSLDKGLLVIFLLLFIHSF